MAALRWHKWGSPSRTASFAYLNSSLFWAIILDVQPIFLTFILILLLASFGGEFLVFYLKKLLVYSRARFSFDASGIIERMMLVTLIFVGGWSMLLIPVIMVARAAYVLDWSRLKRFSDIINKREPAVEFQKVKLKSDIILTLLASPALGLLFGILTKIL